MSVTLRRLTLEQDGIPGWIAHPLTEARRPAVLMLHHAPGLTGDYKANAALLAQLGFTVMVPNLYNMLGIPGDNHHGQGPEIQTRHGDADFLHVIGEAWRALAARPDVDPEHIAVMGHCLGGRLAIPFAADTPAVRSLVLYYATIRDDAVSELRPRHPFETAKLVKCPSLVFYGGSDHLTVPAIQLRLWQSFVDGGAPLEWHYFGDGAHGFANPDYQFYQPDFSQLAWRLTCDFLERRLA